MEIQSLVRYYDSPGAMDPFLVSADCLLVVAFPKSSSKNYAFALSLAGGAQHYQVVEFAGKPMHVAAFAKTQADAGRAVALLDYVRSWKGALVFAQGKLVQNSYQAAQVINCFLDACACSDWRAHCGTVIDDPFSETPEDLNLTFCIRLVEEPPVKQEVEIDQYFFPCKFLHNRFRFQRGHPSTPRDQIQAVGVQTGCAICPAFDPDSFRKTGVRVALEDASDHASTIWAQRPLGDGSEG